MEVVGWRWEGLGLGSGLGCDAIWDVVAGFRGAVRGRPEG